MTLEKCRSHFTIEMSERENSDALISEFQFENQEHEQFKKRLEKYLNSVTDIIPQVKDHNFKISSYNTFPHSTGIASSASAMSAFCTGIEALLTQSESVTELDIKKVSMLARLASGSACRSVLENYAIWGEHNDLEGSSNDHAILLESFHENFSQMCDSILVVDAAEKAVSSSQGHELMHQHPYKEARIEQANKNISEVLQAMQIGDYEKFGEILELEALTLHALMMSSTPSFVLLRPDSLAIIEAIRNFRAETKLPLYFTIDAGPNMHLIYPESIRSKVDEFIQSISSTYINRIDDIIGTGVRFES